MVSKNDSTMKQSWVAERCCPHYRLQKLTIGVASVLLGTTLYFGGSTIVHADTVATGSEENSVVKPVGPNTAGSTVVPTTSTSSRPELTNDAGENTQTEVNSPQSTNDKVTGNSADVPSNAPTGAVSQDQGRSQAGTDSSTLVSVVPSSANVTPTGDTTGTYQLTHLRAFVMPMAGLMESKVATTTNGGYDRAKWGILDTSAWSLNRHDDGQMWLDSYHGDTQHVIIPNAADFGQTERDEIYISPELIHKLVVDDHCKTLAISKTDGKKVAVIDNHVYQGHNGGQLSNAFGGTVGDDGKSYFDINSAPNGKANTSMYWSQVNRTLTNLDLTNLDVSQVTSGFGMFNSLRNLQEVGDLSNWDTHNFTDMSYMFNTENDLLTSLGNLSNWNTSKVTNMANMFCGNGSLKSLGDLSRWQTGNVTNMSMMFTRDRSLTSLDLSNWDTHNVTDMHAMFFNDDLLTSLGDLSNWDTSEVTNMRAMFANDGSLTSLDGLSHWDTSKVTNMQSVFSNDGFLTSLGDLSHWKTGNVTDMSSMFNGMPVLSNVGDLSNWDTSKVTNMQYMFNGDGSLTNIGDLSGWDTSNVIDMSNMFQLASKLKDLGNLGSWKTGNVMDMSRMFNGDVSLTNIGDLSDWDTSNVTNMSYMFQSDGKLTDLGNLDHWKTGNAMDMSFMFNNMPSLTNIGDLSHWDTHNVGNMGYMFNNDGSLVSIGDLSNWDTSNVRDMSFMFQSASKLTDLGNLNNWKTGNVWDMSRMFNGDESLTNIGDLSKWDTSNVTNMSYMFQSDGKLKNLGNLDYWKTGNVTDMSFMFNNMPALTNVGDLSSWDTHNVENMSFMFNNDGSLVSLGDLSSWDTSNVTNMSFMFQLAGKLKDLGNLGGWKTGKVTDMSRMFNFDESLTNIGDLSNWDTSKVTNMSYMFQSDSKLKNLGNLGRWQTGNVTDMNRMFNNMSALTSLGDLSNWDVHNVKDMSFMFNNMPNAAQLSNNFSKWKMDNVTTVQSMFGSPEAQKRFNISNFNLVNVSADASKQAMTDFIGTPESLVIANHVSFPSVDLKAQRTFGDQSVVLTDNQHLLSKTKDNAPVDTIKFVDSEGNLLASYQRPVFYQDTGATNITYDNALSMVKSIVDQNNQQFLQSQRLNGRSLLSLYQLQSLEENNPVKYANGTFVLRRRQAPIVVNYLDATTNQVVGKPVTVNGKVGLAQTVDLTAGLLDGYQLFGGVSQTISLTPITAAGVSYDVLVKHRLAFINSNANYSTDSVIPGTKAKHFTTALGPAQLTSTVHRQIVIKDASGEVVKTVPQTITFVRNAVVDAVTGQVQYLNWSYDGQYVLSAYQPVARDGYQINAAPSIQVTPTSKLADIELQYQVIAAPQKVAFVTSDGNVLSTKDLPSNGDFSSLVPAGYRAATTSSVISQRDLAKETTYQVLVEPNVTTYTDRDQLPSQVKEPLVKTITRTVNIMMPNGRVRKVIQRVRFTRTVTVSATGEVMYGNWTGVGRTSFNHLFVPERHGYHLVMTNSHGQTLTGVDKMAVDATMDDMIINVKYVK